MRQFSSSINILVHLVTNQLGSAISPSFAKANRLSPVTTRSGRLKAKESGFFLEFEKKSTFFILPVILAGEINP